MSNFNFKFFLNLFFIVVSFFLINFTSNNFFVIESFTLNNLETLIFFSADNTNSIDTEILARRLGSGLATAGLGGVGTGIGLVFGALINGFSWNPSLKDDLFSYAIFGFALTEAIGLFALMIAFMLLYA